MGRFYFDHCLGFTSEAAGGNAAGVVLPEQDQLLFTDAKRQAAAKTLGFSATVFVSSIVPGESASVVISLRYMTPLAEVDLCGYATIACLGLLHTSGRLGGICHGKLRTRAGEVGFRIEEPTGRGGDDGRAADAVVFMQQLAPAISAPLQARTLHPVNCCANAPHCASACASAPLRLCTPAPLRLCASALLCLRASVALHTTPMRRCTPAPLLGHICREPS